MMDYRTKKLLATVATALIAIAGVLLVLSGVDEKETKVIEAPVEKPAIPNTVGVDGPDRDAKPDTVIQLDREAREVAQKVQQTPEQFDMAGDLRGRDTAPVAPQVGPLATPNFPGCSTRILPTNWSGSGHAKKAIGLHYTAGGNRSGLSDMNGLTSYASSSAAGVSWHFLIDAEGHCYYSVPLSSRAWTIGNLNRDTVNIEVIGRGNERTYPAGSAGQKKLTEVVQRIGKVYGIPMTVGAVSNCNVTRRGIITHWQGGSCSGGHHDIRPYALDREVAEIRAGTVKPVTTHARKLCQELNRRRKAKDWGDRATKVKKALVKARYVCKYGPPGSIRRK
jgi:hypothetical protein